MNVKKAKITRTGEED